MKYEQSVLELFLHNILNGFSPFVLQNKLFLAKHITAIDVFEANSFCLLKKEKLKKAGCASEYDLLKKYIENQVWTRDKDDRMLFLEKVIKSKRETKEKLLLPSQVAQLDGEISQFSNELSKIKKEKQSLLVNSIEYKILIEKRDYIAYLCLCDVNRVRLWNSYQEFLDSDDAEYIEELIHLYYQTIDENNSDIIRAIARETDARHRLKICPMPSFDKISVLFTELKQWCDFYASIYDLSDRPDEEIIHDDAKLDKWIIGRKFRNEEQKSVNSSGERSFTGVIGSRDDVDALGGVSGNIAKEMAKKNG